MPHWLELGKFTVYVGLPIGIAYAFSDPETINKAINYYRFIVYPPENQASTDSIRALEKEQFEIRRQKQLQQNQDQKSA